MKHPVNQKHREELTFGQRAADATRNTMGSWGFVIGFLTLMAVWAFVNAVLYLGGSNGKHGFDPYPFILLNLMLSMMAGLQGAILLIAAKRQDAISAALAEHDYSTNQKALKEIELLKTDVELTREELAGVNHVMAEMDQSLKNQHAGMNKLDASLANQARILTLLEPKTVKKAAVKKAPVKKPTKGKPSGRS